MGAALSAMRRHEDAWPFRDPVSRVEVPDYYDIIRVRSQMDAFDEIPLFDGHACESPF